VLTESADYLQLENAALLNNPTDYTLAFGNGGGDISGGCMSSGLLCYQLWTIATADIACPTTLTGEYTFQFDLGCNDAVSGYEDATTLCNEYVTEYGGVVTLSTELEWEDTICDPEVFLIEFDATIEFYTDDTFDTALEEGDQYNLGEQAFVQVFIL